MLPVTAQLALTPGALQLAPAKEVAETQLPASQYLAQMSKRLA